MISTKQKRLDTIEINLTPKEWAIRTVDEFRKYATMADFMYTIAKEPSDKAVLFKPFHALKKQIEEQYPGNKPDDIRAKDKLIRALQKEYLTSKLLVLDINYEIIIQGEMAGLKAALKLSKLETIVLQDAFGRTARKAAEWVQEYKTADTEEEESRQGMLEELAAYTDISFGEKWSDSVPLPGGGRFRFPSLIEDWIAEVTALTHAVFSLRAAVQIIQTKYFDGHAILFLDVEAGLENAIRTLENGIATLNEYLKTRAALFGEEWEEEAADNEGVSSAIPGEREGKLAINLDIITRFAKIAGKKKADAWVKFAKEQTTMEALEIEEKDNYSWARFREYAGVKP